MDVNIEDATFTLLTEIDGKVHLMGFSRDKLDMIEFLIKNSVQVVIPTGRNQLELNKFLNYRG